MENTGWEPLINYQGLYEINRDGTIRSLYNRNLKKEIKPRIDRGGYQTVRLSKGGITKTYFLHRLIAENFIIKIEGKAFVNHINGNKLDNRIENLEWVTHAENIKHGYTNSLIAKTTRAVIDICNQTVFLSLKEAAEFYGINYFTLRNYLNGNIKNITCLKYKEAA